jgi:hypothetical protein
VLQVISAEVLEIVGTCQSAAPAVLLPSFSASVAIQQASACYGWLWGRAILNESSTGPARRIVIEATYRL